VSAKTEALEKLRAFLDEYHIRYMVIGGLANTVWGRPRLTYDADVKVVLEGLSIREFGELVGRRFAFRRADAIDFAQRSYVLLVQATEDVPADVVIGLLPYEAESIERAVPEEIEGIAVPVCTAEDLIIHKAISTRERDWLDIEGVLLRQHDRLDQAYIEAWLEEFAHDLDRPQILSHYRELRAQLDL
jgi:hypothetical protein